MAIESAEEYKKLEGITPEVETARSHDLMPTMEEELVELEESAVDMLSVQKKEQPTQEQSEQQPRMTEREQYHAMLEIDNELTPKLNAMIREHREKMDDRMYIIVQDITRALKNIVKFYKEMPMDDKVRRGEMSKRIIEIYTAKIFLVQDLLNRLHHEKEG